MANFTPGLTTALDSLQWRKAEAAKIDAMQRSLAMDEFLQKQRQEEQERQHQAQLRNLEYLSQQGQASDQVSPPPSGTTVTGQPPTPGQASTPQVTPQMMAAFGGGQPPPTGAPPGMPSATLGWTRSAATPPSLGGQPGMPPSAPGQVAPPPAPPTFEQKAMAAPPTTYQSVQKMVDWANKQGMTPDERLAFVQAGMPLIERQQKDQMDQLRYQTELMNAKTAFEKAWKANNPPPGGTKAQDAEIRRAVFTAGGDPDKPLSQQSPDIIAKARRIVGAEEGRKGRVTGEGGGAAAPLPTGGFDAVYNKMGEEEQIALDTQAWNYIKTKQLPYRKGTGGGKDANQRVMADVGRIGKVLGMSGEELSNASAEFKGNAQSMYFQIKKLDAIEGTLASFHNNIETWNSFAQGIAPKIGGEKAKALAGDLRKIDFTGVKSIDEAILKVRQQFDDPTVAAYMVSAMTVAMDYARIMQGPQSVASLTEGARKDAERLISAGYNDKARAGIIAALESDAQGQVKGVRDQLQKIRGRMELTRGGAGAGGESTKTVNWSDLK